MARIALLVLLVSLAVVTVVSGGLIPDIPSGGLPGAPGLPKADDALGGAGALSNPLGKDDLSKNIPGLNKQ